MINNANSDMTGSGTSISCDRVCDTIGCRNPAVRILEDDLRANYSEQLCALHYAELCQIRPLVASHYRQISRRTPVVRATCGAPTL